MKIQTALVNTAFLLLFALDKPKPHRIIENQGGGIMLLVIMIGLEYYGEPNIYF